MMKLAEWDALLARGSNQHFAPSGRALAFQPDEPSRTLRSLEIHFSDGRPPLVFEDDGTIRLLAWASETELVYDKLRRPFVRGAEPTLHVFCVEDSTSHSLAITKDAKSVVNMGTSGHLSVLTRLEGKSGLFDLDVRTGTMARMPAFDKALDPLILCTALGHSWSADRQEVALISCRHNYLEEGMEQTEANSQTRPLLDRSSAREEMTFGPDGNSATQGEVSQEAKRESPFRLFLLDKTGGVEEIPGTRGAQHPLWSPDGSTLVFTRFVESQHELWLLNRSDLSLRRIGGYLIGEPIRHPSGVFFCDMIDETIPNTKEYQTDRLLSREWRRLLAKNGDIHLSIKRKIPNVDHNGRRDLKRPERGYIH